MALIRDKIRASGYVATLATYFAPTELYESVERHRGILVQPFSRYPELADGAWQTTTVVGDGFPKSVLNSNHAGPPKLVAIEEAIDALSKKVVGINGDR